MSERGTVMDNFPKMADGVAKPATPEDIAQDAQGYTTPNLHRIIDPSHPDTEVRDRKYTIGVYDGVHSMRTVEQFYHDEESETCEIP